MFTESCYIHIESDEMRGRIVAELEKIGFVHFYSKDCLLKSFPHIIHTVDYGDGKSRYIDIYDDTPYFRTLKESGRHDCENNENLFLALAALRDDSDYMQYFFYPDHDIWFLCRQNKLDHFYTEWDGAEVDIIELIKKASKDELIKHFSNGSKLENTTTYCR